MSKIKVDEPVKEPTPKTEEQIRAELQAEYEKIADKKVTGALKKQEKRWADKLNADRQEQEQENTIRQEEQAKADEARERDIITKSLKLVVVDALQELRLDPSMRNLIMVEDLVNLPEGQRVEKLTDRVMCLTHLRAPYSYPSPSYLYHGGYASLRMLSLAVKHNDIDYPHISL